MSHSVPIASYYRALTLLLVVLFHGGEAYAKGYAPAAFFGLEGISVLVEDLDEDTLQAGLTRERLETVVALRLRKAGIPILKPSADQEGQPFLYVRVTTIRIADEMLFAYAVEVELRQHVRIERESPFIKGGHARVASATTGSDGAMGYAGRRVFASVVTERVEEFIDNFALAYLKSKDIERSEGLGEPKEQEPKGSAKSMHQSVQL